MSMSLHLVIECSHTKIYQRIIECLSAELVRRGHSTTLINPGEFNNLEGYLEALNRAAPDAILIPNPSGLITSYDKITDSHLFEKTDTKLIFLHHDNLFSNLCDTASISRLIRAYQRESHRSYHYCIERHNCIDLIELGISQAFPIEHATEFSPEAAPFNSFSEETDRHEVSFVGHVLPRLGQGFEANPFSHHLAADFWKRVTDLSHTIEPSAEAIAQLVVDKNASMIDKMTMKYFYHSSLHMLSQHLRGEVISRAGTRRISIIGGDPAYLHGVKREDKINKDNITYHKPTSLPIDAARIYRSSKISINITPLQFDSALINRVLDIAAAGGFPLTDWKAELANVTSLHREISYRSPEELEAKIEYYLHPEHEEERKEIAAVLRAEVLQKSSYSGVVDTIFARLEAQSSAAIQPIKVDLGCGRHKATGFIGVDNYQALGVDVIADLTMRFPFATSAVEEVRAHDIVEHLPDQLHTMNEIWRICKPEALVDIRVPSTDGRGAFQDPTHVSFWNINSFNYYCIEFPAYLELCKTYGFKGMFSLIAIEEETSSDGVIHVRARLKALKHQADPTTNRPRIQIMVLANSPNAEFAEQNYNRLKELVQAAILHPSSKIVTLLVKVNGMSPPDVEAMLTSLMMELIFEGGVEDPENAPTLRVYSEGTDLDLEQAGKFDSIIDLETFEIHTLNDLLA